MPVETQHIVKSFDEELQRLRQTVAQMGGLVEAQLQAAVDALVKRDAEAAAKVVRDDARIDDLEQQLGNLVIRLLALRQPMAVDLRQIVSALKISSDLERIGDYAAIPRMARLVQQIIKDVLDSYVEQDAAKAIAAWQRDEEVDEMYTSLFRELLTYMMEDQRNIGPSIHLLFIAKNIERMGDHATNVAEDVHFLVHGRPLDQARPKGDQTSFTVVATTPGAGVEQA
jgi:phosphate transport system protein